MQATVIKVNWIDLKAFHQTYWSFREDHWI